MRILIAGAPDAVNEPANETAATARSDVPAPSGGVHLRPLTRMLAIGGLASADAVLLLWTANYVFSHKHALSFWGAAGCTGSVLIAALCGTAAVSLVVFSDKK